VEIGPKNITLRDQEILVEGPCNMIVVPRGHYCTIKNPVVTENGSVVMNEHGQAKLRHGDQEIRFSSEPFPLYPGEEVLQN